MKFSGFHPIRQVVLVLCYKELCFRFRSLSIILYWLYFPHLFSGLRLGFIRTFFECAGRCDYRAVWRLRT